MIFIVDQEVNLDPIQVSENEYTQNEIIMNITKKKQTI